MAGVELADWVKRAKQGDRAAFEQLVRATGRVVYAHIVAAVRDRQKAEDLTQETFLTAWKQREAIEDPSGFTAWLLTLARHAVVDRVKFEQRQKRRGDRASGSGDEVAAPDAPPSEAAERAEAVAAAVRRLEELPADYREPLMMRYLAGADYETIRAQLQLTDGALRGLLQRGMAMLRERMTSSDK